MTKKEFLLLEAKSRQVVKVSMNYVDMAQDLHSGLLLSQIIYWFLPSKSGKSKLRVKRNDKIWLAKKREDWWKETRLTPRQVDKALNNLIKRGYLEKRLFKFAGEPTTHITVIWENFLSVFSSMSRFCFDETVGYSGIPINQTVNSNSPNETIPYTETTTENTNINTIGQINSIASQKVSSQAVKESVNKITFSKFWTLYPRKISKPNAFKAWLKINPDDTLFNRICNAVVKQMTEGNALAVREDGGKQFIPHPASWLNAGRWDDELTVEPDPTTTELSEEQKQANREARKKMSKGMLE